MRLGLGCQLSANRRNLSHAFAADNWKNCRFYGPLHWEIGGQLADPRNVPSPHSWYSLFSVCVELIARAIVRTESIGNYFAVHYSP